MFTVCIIKVENENLLSTNCVICKLQITSSVELIYSENMFIYN